MKNFKKVLIILLIIIYISTLLFILVKSNIIKQDSKQPLIIEKVYNNMKNLKNVTIKRYTNEVFCKDGCISGLKDVGYKYDIVKRRAESEYVDYKQDKIKYYFVYDNNKYFYYDEDKWNKIDIPYYYLDDYHYILELLKNTKSAEKTEKNTYNLIIDSRKVNNYIKYFKETHSNYTRGDIKLNVKIVLDSNNYLTNIKIYIKDDLSSYNYINISYSDFNKSDVNIPVGILSKVYN